MIKSQSDSWEQISKRIRDRVSSDGFDRWFSGVRIAAISNDTVTLCVPNPIHQFFIESNYLPIVKESVQATLPTVTQVEFTSSNEVEIAPRPSAPTQKAPREKAPATLAGAMNPRNTFEAFVVGSNNEFAHSAALAVAKSPATTYNPLFIYGVSGLGKTHLLHAIGHHVQATNKSAKIVYLSSEQFTNEFIDAIQHGTLVKFRKKYRQADVLLIDDIQFFAGKERSQEEFFHTFNTLLDGRNQVVLTCDRPACEIKSLEPRLVSRFECGLTVELQPPQMETRLAILRKKALDWKVRLDESVLSFLAQKILTNVRRLEGALMRVATYASLAGESVTVDKVEHLLRDLIREEASRQVSIDAIQKAVADQFDVRLADMTSRRRPASIAFPRQVAMYLSRSLTKGSLVEIGEAFGGRDHTTVMHADRKIRQLMAERRSIYNQVTELTNRIKQQAQK